MKKPNIDTTDMSIDKFFDNKIDKIYPSNDELKKILKTGKQLRFYMGADTTAPRLHIGHVIPFLKMAELQKMGHEIIFLMGDFTAMIGDPTDKSATRIKLTKDEVTKNAKAFLSQITNLIDFESKENPAKVLYNSTWNSKLKFEDVINLASNFTVQQMIERDMFQQRIQSNKPIYLHEFLYPLIQGYDSVAMEVDGEFGGSDQTFNMLAGRDLVRNFLNKEKFVITTKLLLSSDGINKMSKSIGNCIFINDTPEEKYGKVMAIPDSLIMHYYEILTDFDSQKLLSIKKNIENNPMAEKKALSFKIVEMFDGKNDAVKAQQYFEKTVQKKEAPEDIVEIKRNTLNVNMPISVKELLFTLKLVSSKSDAKRLVGEGAIEIDGQLINDPNEQIDINKISLIQSGKRKWRKLI